MYSTQNERSAAFAKMLENCKNYDKDIRYTGANDLCNEIVKSQEVGCGAGGETKFNQIKV